MYCLEFNQNQVTEIVFVYAPKGAGSEAIIYKNHCRLWNENRTNVLVAVTEDETFLINPKIKPNEHKPLIGKIDTPFKSGALTDIDSTTYDYLSRQKVNAGYFFEFVWEKTKRNREEEVDKDLLLNLIALRQDLIAADTPEKVADLMILRCLFLKYLEDRGIYPSNYVSNILETAQPAVLIDAFESVGRINGDIFKNEPILKTTFSHVQMQYLHRFFNSDYRSKQATLFPYQFQYIPIQLISHVYEAFLDSAKKQGKGIYYTPQFIVRFMLEETLTPVLEHNPDVTVMDPACGSGAFLVEGFQKIVRAKGAERDFEAKKDILVRQIYGIDNDAQALRIATFSLYLALLEGLDAAFIQKQIEDNAPILPGLFGKNLLHGNTLTKDNLFDGKTFDCIVGNPPWGSVPKDDDREHLDERRAIGDKGKPGLNPAYQSVSDFQRSQAFILRVKKWLAADSLAGLITNNSNFLNENAKLFRASFLQQYRIVRFYELSNLSPILFKKEIIGEVNGQKIETGATEPAAFCVFSNSENEGNKINYVAPRLTNLSKYLKLVHFTQRDERIFPQSTLLDNDLAWKVLVNGDWDDYQLISKTIAERNTVFKIECRSGFQPKKDMIPTGEPEYRPLVKSADINPYFVNEKLSKFNWNQTLHRKRDEYIFQGDSILVPVRPTENDDFRLRGARVSEGEVFQDDVLGIKINHNGKYINAYIAVLGIFNSSFIGYFSFLIATQWGKGDLKRSTLRNYDLEAIPLPAIDENDPCVSRLTQAVLEMERFKKDPFGGDTEVLQQEIDELVFDLYGLMDFERETVREFYDIHVHRKDALVAERDLAAYAQKFKSVFELMLADHLTLCCEYQISRQVGAFVCFRIVEKSENPALVTQSNIEDSTVFHAIKQAQLESAFESNRLNELPTRVYTPERFFLIKSHFFKDWTIRQAITDANEEVKIMTQETQATP